MGMKEEVVLQEGNETIPELDVELITTYNEQTASFNNFGNYQKKFYSSCSTEL